MQSNFLTLKEFGDFQTPIDFAEKICELVKQKTRSEFDIIVEPTFGVGNFIFSCISVFKNARNIFGIEINKDYFDEVKEKIAKSDQQKANSNGILLFNDDFFKFDFDLIKSGLNANDKVLLIGNPPWVTNSYLGNIESNNLPVKSNFKGFSGLDAMTGKGNFDIAESIIKSVITEFQEFDVTVAFLCKSIIVQNFLKSYRSLPFKLSVMEIYNFNSESVFGACCDSCLFFAKVGREQTLKCDVFDLDSQKRIYAFGWHDNKFISNLDNYMENQAIDGISCFEWRQGLKHDCSPVMELTKIGENRYINGKKEELVLESDNIYPILKSSDLKTGIIETTRKYVIVTQKKIKADTSYLKNTSPKLWKYLMSKKERMDNRKSSIYKNSPPFSIFGIGDYSFKPYKVAISGFYKEPLFCLVGTIDNKPVMLDDTCYFLSFDDYETALIIMLVLNSGMVNQFIKSLAFINAKRPYTKEILMRVDVGKCMELIRYPEIREIAQIYAPNAKIDEEMYGKISQAIQSKIKND